jgi:membrane fusion protein (multidrug efflux system)
MDKKKLLIGFAVVAIAGAAFFIYKHLMFVTTDNAQIEAHSVMLAPKVPGYVTKVNVVEGQKVEGGEVLVEIDSRDYENALRQLKGELASAEAKKSDAERTFKRLSDLYAKEAVSQQQYDQASTAFRESRSKFEAISAQVAQAELNVENTKIRAPLAGFIARKSVELGQLAAAGVPLIGFVGAQDRWVIANFKETEIAGIKPGAKVEVDVDAIGSRVFHGLVVAVSAATGATFTLLPPDNATGNFTKVVQRVPVRIKLEDLTADDIELLRAGLSANVSVHKH